VIPTTSPSEVPPAIQPLVLLPTQSPPSTILVVETPPVVEQTPPEVIRQLPPKPPRN
jgi:hypothetical protein